MTKSLDQALTYSRPRNRILNPAMMVSQERGAAAVAVAANSLAYPIDGWQVAVGPAGAVSAQQVALTTPGGSPNRLRVSVTTAVASLAAGDFCIIRTPLEGIMVADFGDGAVGAKARSLRLGVRFPAGTYGYQLRNAAGDRVYTGFFTISAAQAGTDVLVPVPNIFGDVTGTWAKDSTTGLYVSIAIAAGSSWQTSNLNAWQVGAFMGPTTQTNGMASTANTFDIFDVGLYAGSGLPDFEVPKYDDVLRDCMRYYEYQGFVLNTSLSVLSTGYWTVEKRITPAISYVADNGSGAVISPMNPILGGGAISRKAFYQSATHSGQNSALVFGNARL